MYGAINQCREDLGLTAGLNQGSVPQGVEAKAAEDVDHEIMAVASEPSDANFFPFEVLRFFDLGLGQEAEGQNIFEAANEDKIGGSLDVGPDKPNPSGQRDLHVAAEQSRGGDLRRRYVHVIEVQLIF